jgi:hypothetical protein
MHMRLTFVSLTSACTLNLSGIPLRIAGGSPEATPLPLSSDLLVLTPASSSTATGSPWTLQHFLLQVSLEVSMAVLI